ncbi:MAG: hypothetical protein HDS22_06460 [Bacteroides sp.]|nr:hypothetical protein [Bacteroides sp.]
MRRNILPDTASHQMILTSISIIEIPIAINEAFLKRLLAFSFMALLIASRLFSLLYEKYLITPAVT